MNEWNRSRASCVIVKSNCIVQFYPIDNKMQSLMIVTAKSKNLTIQEKKCYTHLCYISKGQIKLKLEFFAITYKSKIHLIWAHAYKI